MSYRIYNGRQKAAPFEGYQGPIINYPLNPEAATKWAADILPSAFISNIGLRNGVWTAPLPESMPEKAASNFEIGVMPEPPVSEWKPFNADDFSPEWSERISSSLNCTPAELVCVPKLSLVLFATKWAFEYLSTAPSAVLLIREMRPETLQAKLPVWKTAMGAFYPVTGTQLDELGMADLMDDVTINRNYFVLLSTCGSLDPSTSLSISEGDLIRLITSANGFILGAYDGEGYIRWSRAV